MPQRGDPPRVSFAAETGESSGREVLVSERLEYDEVTHPSDDTRERPDEHRTAAAPGRGEQVPDSSTRKSTRMRVALAAARPNRGPGVHGRAQISATLINATGARLLR